MQITAQAETGILQVQTTSNRGFTPEELANGALDRILFIGDTTHPVIKEQAVAFREQIRGVLVHYMHQAIKSDRTTLANTFKTSGHPELVKLLEI
jgi:hypothetical protein